MKKFALPLVLLLASASVVATNAAPAFAQDMSNGVDNFYKSDSVDVEKISFKNKLGMNVVGNLFTPKTLDRDTPSPAIIVGHPMGAGLTHKGSKSCAQASAEEAGACE